MTRAAPALPGRIPVCAGSVDNGDEGLANELDNRFGKGLTSWRLGQVLDASHKAFGRCK